MLYLRKFKFITSNTTNIIKSKRNKMKEIDNASQRNLNIIAISI